MTEVWYYAEYEWKDPNELSPLWGSKVDGHKSKKFSDDPITRLTQEQFDSMALEYFKTIETTCLQSGKIYLQVVYTENDDGSFRNIYSAT